MGLLTDNNYVRRTSAGTYDMSAAGTPVLGFSSTTVTALQNLQCNNKLQYNQAGSIAIATTITWVLYPLRSVISPRPMC